jgi:hypothetical protein
MAAVENRAPEAESPEKQQQQRTPKEVFEPPPLLRAVMTYISYIVLYAVSLVGDTLRKLGLKTSGHVEVTKKEVGVLCASSSLSRVVFCFSGLVQDEPRLRDVLRPEHVPPRARLLEPSHSQHTWSLH